MIGTAPGGIVAGLYPPRLETRPNHGVGDAQRVDQRAVVAGGPAVGEAEIDRHAHHPQAEARGAHDDGALGLEARLREAGAVDQAARVDPEAALDVGERATSEAGDGARRPAVAGAPRRVHAGEQVLAAAD